MNTHLKNLDKVWRIWEDMSDEEMEDRREYDQEMLEKMYELNEEQSIYLLELLKLQFNQDYVSLYGFIPMHRSSAPDDTSVRQDAVCENILESMHQGFDGYSDGEKVIITKYLMDLGVAANVTYRDRKAS